MPQNLENKHTGILKPTDKLEVKFHAAPVRAPQSSPPREYDCHLINIQVKKATVYDIKNTILHIRIRLLRYVYISMIYIPLSCQLHSVTLRWRHQPGRWRDPKVCALELSMKIIGKNHEKPVVEISGRKFSSTKFPLEKRFSKKIQHQNSNSQDPHPVRRHWLEAPNLSPQ